MGCPCSKRLDHSAPSNPLQQLKAAEAPRRGQHRRRRQEEKRQRQLAKLQKRNARKRRHQQRGGGGDSLRRRSHNNNLVHSKLRLRGGSNGSSATECVSSLYARTLEQQREEHQLSMELKMGHQLERELHTFLLNQLLLGIQFFGHFEHELAAIDDQLLAKQRECSQTLAEHSLIYASAIDAAVAKRLLFKPIDGPHRNQDQKRDRERGPAHASSTAEPLQKPLTYVVFENVDVARPNDANYDSISALCKVLLETDYYNTTPCRAQYVQLLEQSRWMGYVRLKLREATPKQHGSGDSPSDDGDGDMDTDGVYTDGSSGYSTGTGTGTGTRRGSWDEGDYDHVYIARLNTQRSLEELKLPRVQLERNVLPEACVCRLGSCLPAWLEQSDDDDDDDVDSSESSSEPEEDLEQEADQGHQLEQRSGYETVQVLRQCRVEQLRRRVLLQQCYLSSQQFMHYFGELLRQQLAQELGIHLSGGSYRGCSIYTAEEELVPAIHVPHGWPDCAFEFNLRARPQHTNPQTGDKFQWPTAAVRKRIQSFGYHVVPAGYAPKRARNPFRELEWRIVFPQAEQLLERQLTRTQLKLLLVLKTLVRSFCNDKCPSMGHIMEQLRTHLFWHCERHGDDFTEQFLGEQLTRFVRSFVDSLARKQLSDYFIERRNLFEHVPEDALMELRSIMAGIAEQPLVHVLQALRNLQHAHDFYPKLNYAQVLDTLLTTDYLQLRHKAKFSRNPLIATTTEQEQETLREQPAVQSDPEGLLGMRLHQERTRGKLRRKTQLLRAQTQLKLAEVAEQDSLTLDLPLLQLQLQPRASQASLSSASVSGSVSATPQLNDGVEILRRTNLLELLLDHMLAMLSKATELRNAQHAHLYLEQSQRLCRLYQQLGCSQNAQHYAESICQAASRLERSSSSPRVSCSSNSHRKCLKFVEHVVQLHTDDILPMQRSPPAPPQPSQSAPASSTDEFTVETTPQTEAATVADATSSKEAITTLETLLQRIQLDSPVAIQAISSKAEQLMQNLELLDLLKRNKQKLKNVFN
ncbi:hypothetical protein ACLKA6_008359 [Drosophila palustris]